jgi:hypothetical protein
MNDWPANNSGFFLFTVLNRGILTKLNIETLYKKGDNLWLEK